MKSFLYIVLISLLFFSCGGNSNSNEETNQDTVTTSVENNINEQVTAADTSTSGVYQEETTDEETSLEDALRNNTEEVVEEGGLSFCECVKKQKALEKTMLETEDDDEFDKAMAEMEAMKTGECKILFAGSQNTLEEKKAHERKVKACL